MQISKVRGKLTVKLYRTFFFFTEHFENHTGKMATLIFF